MYNKNIKRIVSISSAAMMMLSALTVAPAAELATLYAADEMTAFEITENMKIGWNLGNTLDATMTDENGAYVVNPGLATETAWGCSMATQELFDAIM